MEKEMLLFKTSDLNLASALLATGFGIDATDNSNPARVFFYFDKTPQLDEVVRRYWSGNLSVDAKDIGLCRREILARVHEQTNTEKLRKETPDNRIQGSPDNTQRETHKDL